MAGTLLSFCIRPTDVIPVPNSLLANSNLTQYHIAERGGLVDNANDWYNAYKIFCDVTCQSEIKLLCHVTVICVHTHTAISEFRCRCGLCDCHNVQRRHFFEVIDILYGRVHSFRGIIFSGCTEIYLHPLTVDWAIQSKQHAHTDGRTTRKHNASSSGTMSCLSAGWMGGGMWPFSATLYTKTTPRGK